MLKVTKYWEDIVIVILVIISMAILRYNTSTHWLPVKGFAATLIMVAAIFAMSKWAETIRDRSHKNNK